MPFAMLGEAATTIDWSTIITANSFAPLLNGISTVLPVVIPIGLSLAAVPIVWKYLKKFMRG